MMMAMAMEANERNVFFYGHSQFLRNYLDGQKEAKTMRKRTVKEVNRIT